MSDTDKKWKEEIMQKLNHLDNNDKINNIDSNLTNISNNLARQNDRIEAILLRLEETEKRLKKTEELVELKDQQLLSLQKSHDEKDTMLTSLQLRVNDLEQYSRRDNLILTGFKIAPVSRVVAPRNEDTSTSEDLQEPVLHTNDRDTMANNFVNIVNHKMGANISVSDILEIHTLPVKRGSPTKSIVRFNNRRARDRIMHTRKNLKGEVEPMFINEHLTHYNANIAYRARQMKKEKRIQDTWTMNCKIYVKLNDGKIDTVNSTEQLQLI